MFVCSKHFPEGKPTDRVPDPEQATPGTGQGCTPAKPRPRRRSDSEPPAFRKKRKILQEFDTSAVDDNRQTILSSASTDSYTHTCTGENNLVTRCWPAFSTWINYMFYRFGSVPIWPNREVIQQNMPCKFKEDFPNTIVIPDGTELKLEKPSSLRSQCYSDYKSATTLKGLVGVDPRGSFMFISMLYSGPISDKEITIQSGLLEHQQLLDCGHLRVEDGVMVDKGFLIREEIEKLGLKLFIPPFAPGSGQMSAGDVAMTRKIAKHRVHVERF